MHPEPKPPMTDGFALRWADTVLKFRWMTILFSLVIVAVFGAGLLRLDVSTNYREFFSDRNPDLHALDQFEATFTRADNILIVLKPREGTVAQPRVLEAVEELTDRSWSVPYNTRVDSITNFQHTRGEEDDLIVEDLVFGASALSTAQAEERVAIALAEPLLAGRLISLDAGSTGINITQTFPDISLTEVPDAMNYARDLVAEFKGLYPEIEFAVTGVTAMNSAFAEATVTDAQTLFGPMFLVLVLIAFLIVRTFMGTLATVLVISLSTLTAMGFAGWVGITMSPFSGSAPIVILTLAIADSIHILLTVIQRMRAGDARDVAIREAIRVNFIAVTITSVTTIIGFLALNFSDAPPFNALGNISAVGIAAAWLFSLTFFPAFLSLSKLKIPVSADNRAGPMQRVINAVGEWVISGARRALAVALVIFVGFAAFIPTIDLNDQWVEYFDYRVPFRNDAEFAIDHLTGPYTLEYEVPAQEVGAISDPSYLIRLEAFSNWLRAQPEVSHVYAYTDIIKRLNRNMHGDDDAYFDIPESRELAAQYLLLYELSLPFGLDTNDRIDIDKSATRVSVTMGRISTVEIRAFLTRVDGWWADNGPETKQYATGATYLFSFISQRNITDMIGGNLIAVALISVVMMATLRSIGMGALSLVPNLVPLAVTFGIWAILVGQVGTAAATVSATSLGIIVDNTVHLLTKYQRARQEKGLTPTNAVRYALDTVGAAVAANAMILSLGFAVLALSSFKITAEMGLLTAIAILVALVVDFVLLPALLLVRVHSKTEKGNSDVSTDQIQEA
ncbi:MAG: MMPL family transporter [Thalassovita sp.]